MMVDPDQLRIVLYPDPVLRRKAEEVDARDEAVRAVARRMIELMHEADGVGLAGPQVGLPWRIFVTNAREHDPADRVYINPHLTLGRGVLESVEEGCLSLPDIRVQVRRPVEAEITATDLEGTRFSMASTGFLARVWQHENDHLDGILIVNRATPMDRLRTRKPLKELEAAAAAEGPR
jgi:peptide deformylase